MNIVMNGVLLGLVWFVILLIIMYTIKLYTYIANIIGGKIISFFGYLLRKIKRK